MECWKYFEEHSMPQELYLDQDYIGLIETQQAFALNYSHEMRRPEAEEENR